MALPAPTPNSPVSPQGLAKPTKPLLRLAGKAIEDFGMIRAGDRLLLGLSGGKDSLSLLQVLRTLQV